MNFQVRIEKRSDGVYNVFVFGPLDTASHEEFIKKLITLLIPATKVVVLDLGGVDYVSSLGIGAVHKITRALKDNGSTLLLTNLQPKIKKVFDIVKALPGAVFKSIEEVDAYLDEIQKKSA